MRKIYNLFNSIRNSENILITSENEENNCIILKKVEIEQDLFGALKTGFSFVHNKKFGMEKHYFHFTWLNEKFIAFEDAFFESENQKNRVNFEGEDLENVGKIGLRGYDGLIGYFFSIHINGDNLRKIVSTYKCPIKFRGIYTCRDKNNEIIKSRERIIKFKKRDLEKFLDAVKIYKEIELKRN